MLDIKLSPMRAVAVTVGAVAVAVAGFYAWSAVADTGDADSTALPTNEAGQTYGVDDGEGDRPDLILAEATNGETGYVDQKALDELTGANISTPEEAVAWEKSLESSAWTTKTLPVYLSDGKTLVGEFEIDRGEVADPPPLESGEGASE